MTGSSVPRAARSVRREWDLLSSGTQPLEVFDPSMVARLPEPARRWLVHAIAPGTPLWQTVELSMRGEIRLGAWRPFVARQVLAPPRGFVWAATARFLGIPVTGFDRLSSGSGQMRWRLGGLVPVVSATGPDVTRSAAGRLAGEMVLVPTTFRAATWTPGSDEDRVVVTWRIDGRDESAELQVGQDGRLLGIVVQRWGNPGGAPFGRYPFGVAIEAEQTFTGVTVGSVLRAGWWWGTARQPEGEFFRARITGATFR
ncbi:DUF6544 family protein [Geodermatophilus sp. DSM 45219]|uniref:DUF6544 family protein n=1 Tax=Geodermatophilus sp. DSM 45219 TaxID=1881103 RepID=UPI00088467FB|nr:DUF6544 family protein [Geodermatophilus sp. DSM 45219]SDO30855.1 hypothetical protein SAMN05428965_3454 [Geodermatophilus sp. DSM 45219]